MRQLVITAAKPCCSGIYTVHPLEKWVAWASRRALKHRAKDPASHSRPSETTETERDESRS